MKIPKPESEFSPKKCREYLIKLSKQTAVKNDSPFQRTVHQILYILRID